MKPRRQKATKAEQERYDELKNIPCIACRSMGYDGCGKHEIHHYTSGGRRIGNDKTIPLGSWHHRAVILVGWTKKEMLEIYGPSLETSKRDFHKRFGSERQLLQKTNELLNQ